jgi:hypothetical protein
VEAYLCVNCGTVDGNTRYVGVKHNGRYTYPVYRGYNLDTGDPRVDQLVVTLVSDPANEPAAVGTRRRLCRLP